MRWQGGRQSGNVQDRRGMGGVAVGGGIGTVIIALVVMLLGGDPGTVLQQAPPAAGGAPGGGQQGAAPAANDSARLFVGAVLADTEDTWNPIFKQMGRQYVEPTLVLFTGAEQTACGTGQAAMGPFYCPGDQKVYIDLSFYDDLARMSGAKGDNDFAQAYVIAHEVGHHVQHQLGIADRVSAAQRGAREEEANALSVRLELQADCFAGVWGNKTAYELEAGDVEEALAAATAIGDDRLQQKSQGRIVPESFTHGSSAQRVRWFRRGLDSGDVRQCDTFAADQL
ncbi:MAG TPA: neutral zinc metallopeptidase [Longimicrobium sp.]|jgi:predicted metalloprotease|nr:neutral zinc metallopeptidase [Longimicrobium sp.]